MTQKLTVNNKNFDLPRTSDNNWGEVVTDYLVEMNQVLNNFVAVSNTTGIGVYGATGLAGATGAPGLIGNIGQMGATGLTVLGAQGATGIRGLDGFIGPIGATGLGGNQGLTGPAGFTGLSGITGLRGMTGIIGVTGLIGQTGAQGYTGLRGTTGLIGATGLQGASGTVGQTGVGITGPVGIQGAQGVTGVRGQTGFGSAGTQGVTGVRGFTGLQGVTGLIGVTGLRGLTGSQGTTGAGIQGATGLTGPTGLQGPVGNTTGQSFYFNRDASDIAGYETLGRVPSFNAEHDETILVNSGSGEVLIDSYVTNPDNYDVYPAGLQTFRTHHYVDSATGVTQIVFRVYKRTSGGTETELFNVTSAEINATTITEYTTDILNPSDVMLDATDRIVVKVYAKTTSVVNRTVHFVYEGSLNLSYVVTSFFIEGLQGVTGLQGATGLVGANGSQGVTGLIGATGLAALGDLQVFKASQGATGIFEYNEVYATGMTGLGGGEYAFTAQAGQDSVLVQLGDILTDGVGNLYRIAAGTTLPITTAGTAMVVQYITEDVEPVKYNDSLYVNGGGLVNFTEAQTSPNISLYSDGQGIEIDIHEADSEFLILFEATVKDLNLFNFGGQSFVDIFDELGTLITRSALSPLGFFNLKQVIKSSSRRLYFRIGFISGNPQGTLKIWELEDVNLSVTRLTGVVGPQGSTGLDLGPNYIGATGINGIQGTTGPIGITGLTGVTGLQGVGSTGIVGLQGPLGATGLRGFTGAGIQGATGLSGAVGSTGLSGTQGATGLSGLNGAQGATGLSGLNGSTGLEGAQGATGLAGTSILDYDKMQKYFTNLDAFGVFTTVTWNDATDVTRKVSELSAGTAPQYTTRSVSFYDDTGTFESETVYTLAYDTYGNLISEEV